MPDRGMTIDGPANTSPSANATTIVEPGWRVRVDGPRSPARCWSRSRRARRAQAIEHHGRPGAARGVQPPVHEQSPSRWALQPQNTAYSVNIKERLDFSCAIFDGAGNLIANAPHMPVHLGSMGESDQDGDRAQRRPACCRATCTCSTVIRTTAASAPPRHYLVVTPVFFGHASEGERELPTFYVGSRGHHADIGGTTPGSMPPFSTRIEEEGVQIDNVLAGLPAAASSRPRLSRSCLQSGAHPSRNLGAEPRRPAAPRSRPTRKRRARAASRW